jgi:hypothetical protein
VPTEWIRSALGDLDARGAPRAAVNSVRILVSLVVALFLTACTRHTSSPAELVAALTSTGLHVEEKAEVPPREEWVGAEMGVDLVLDYEEAYTAVRFPSADLARTYCQGGQQAVQFGSWCIEPHAHPPREETWKKVATLGTR